MIAIGTKEGILLLDGCADTCDTTARPLTVRLTVRQWREHFREESRFFRTVLPRVISVNTFAGRRATLILKAPSGWRGRFARTVARWKS